MAGLRRAMILDEVTRKLELSEAVPGLTKDSGILPCCYHGSANPIT